MTRYIMTDVAAARAYLDYHVSILNGVRGWQQMMAYQVKMYWAWLLRRLTSAGLPKGTPRVSYSTILMYSGSVAQKSYIISISL